MKNAYQEKGKANTKKKDTYENVYALYEGRKLTLNAFRSGVFPIKSTQGKGLKILNPKQMLTNISCASKSR